MDGNAHRGEPTEHLARQAGPLGSEHERKPLGDAQATDRHGLGSRCEGPCGQACVVDRVEEIGDRRAGDREVQDLAHRDAHTAPVVGVGAGAVEQQTVGAESASRAGDRAEVLRVVHALQHDERARCADHGVGRSSRWPIGDGDDAAVQVEADDSVEYLLLGDVHVGVFVEMCDAGLHRRVRQYGVWAQSAGQQALDDGQTLGPQHLGALATPQCAERAETRIVDIADFAYRHGTSLAAMADSSAMEHVVVIGASLAGLRACETLRSEGFTGRITMVGAEAEMPYDRPPLSKKLLAGEWEPDRVRLRKPEAFAELDLDLRLGAAATGLDTEARCAHLADGTTIEYEGLVIATGAAVRRLPGQPDLDGVCELRTMADALDLRARLSRGETPVRVVVIGAGFIGLEVAATARQLGCDVTVLEGAPAPLMRGLGAEMGTAVAAVHGRHGVDVRCGVQVAGFEGDGTRVTGVRLGDGSVVAADVVVVGIGVAPATDWLAGSGLTIADGIVCDTTLSTGVPGVYAAGDVARWHNTLFDPHDDAVMRVEHWTNAAEQGAAAARNLLLTTRGEPAQPYAAVPFFWSDQFESRIQFVGRVHGGDEVHVFAGSTDGAFAALYGWEGRLRGVLGVSMPKMVMPFRALIAAQASWQDALVKAAELTA